MKWMAERQPPALSPPQIPPRGNQQRAKNWKSPNRPDGVKPAVEFLPENLRRGGRHGQSEAFAGLPKAHGLSRFRTQVRRFRRAGTIRRRLGLGPLEEKPSSGGT